MPAVLILGATSDIGYAIAKKYAEHKYAVQLAGRKPEQLNALASDLEIRFQVGVSTVAFDAMDLRSHQAFYDSLPVKPDITVCVVGYMNDNEQVIADPAETNRTIVTNFSGPVS